MKKLVCEGDYKLERTTRTRLGMIALFAFGFANPCLCQPAKRFVKVEPQQCWLDVKDYVKSQASGVISDDALHVLRASRFASMWGDIAIVVKVEQDHNKKGELGCSIIVAASGGGTYSSYDQGMNAFLGSANFRLAAQLASEVEYQQKQRDKKAKDKKP